MSLSVFFLSLLLPSLLLVVVMTGGDCLTGNMPVPQLQTEIQAAFDSGKTWWC